MWRHRSDLSHQCISEYPTFTLWILVLLLLTNRLVPALISRKEMSLSLDSKCTLNARYIFRDSNPAPLGDMQAHVTRNFDSSITGRAGSIRSRIISANWSSEPEKTCFKLFLPTAKIRPVPSRAELFRSAASRNCGHRRQLASLLKLSLSKAPRSCWKTA